MKINTGAAGNVGLVLLKTGSATATALADELEMTSAGIRKHLDALLAQGLVESSERAPYGPAALNNPKGRGRPARIFSLTAKGRNFFGEYEGAEPQESKTLTALNFMAENFGESAIAKYAEHVAKTFTKNHPEVQKFSTPQERAMSLVDALNEEGFSASITPGIGDSIQICQHNCPLGDVAQAFPIVCEEETKAFSELTGVHVTRLATIANGHPICTTLVPNPRSNSVKGK